jgi:membrane fusion protein (multidrug efflux system)
MGKQNENSANDSKAQSTAAPPAATEAPPLKAKRKLWLALLAGVFLTAGIGYGLYWWVDLRYIEYTDDAYVGGNVVQITPQISATVIAIGADDTDFVKAGQPLVTLDQADARVALHQAEAQLAKTVRTVRNLFATSEELRAIVAVRQTDLSKAKQDLARREQLAKSGGAISIEDVQHARDAFHDAQAALVAAEQALAANTALIDGTTVENHPDVRAAAARVHAAYLTYARTVLPSPVAGIVAKRTVQLGQRVSPGMALMAVVPLDEVWVDANFKESQLSGMRLGQAVTMTADVYGGAVVFHGHIEGFGAGTGSAFALLPAQNATGNWIKVVQRLPVRIALDPHELAKHPLQIGLSMRVDVNTRDRSGARLPALAQRGNAYETAVFSSIDEQANARVRTIIAENEAQSMARGTRAGRRPPASHGELARSDPRPKAR